MAIPKKSMPEEKAQPIQQVQINLPGDPMTRLLADPNRPAFYANGFSVGTTATECFVIFTQNNVPKVAITLPFPSVLSLQRACEQAIKNYESQVNVKIQPAEELGKAIAEANKKKA